MRAWTIPLALVLLLPGCGTAGSPTPAPTPTPASASASASAQHAASSRGAFDYLYPDNPASEKTPVSVPTGGDGPWKLAHLADYGTFDTLSQVVAASPDDIWAFGQTETWKGKPFALRWDGRRWARGPLPEKAKGAVVDVAAAGPDDVWLLTGTRNHSDVFRWNGERWSAQHGLPYATRIKVVDATHVWAYSFGAIQSIWFFDGNGWQPTALPKGISLEAFDATSPDDLWAIGSFQESGTTATAVFHSDGHGWTRVPLGDTFPADDHLSYVRLGLLVAASREDVWVFGNQIPRVGEEPLDNPLIVPVAAHWDGQTWRRIDIPQVWLPREAMPDGRGGVRILAWPNPGDPDAVAPDTTILSLSADGVSSVSEPDIAGGRVCLTGLAVVSDMVWAVGAAYPVAVTMSASTSVIYTWKP